MSIGLDKEKEEKVESVEAELVNDIPSDARHLAVLVNLIGIIMPLFGPLIVWLIVRNKHPFVDSQGKESLNFQITYFIYEIALATICAFLWFLIIPLLFVPVLIVCYFVFPIIAAVKASKGEDYKYPLIIRFLR